MTVSKRLIHSALIGCICLAISGLYPQKSWAEGFTNKDFLAMKSVYQKYWLDGAINALFHVAAANDEVKGQCVYDWYYGGMMAERNGLIVGSMQKYPDASPSSVLMALTVRACGEYRKG